MAGKNLLVASIVLVVLSLIFEIVGYVSPGWEILFYESSLSSDPIGTRVLVYSRFGLWYTCTPDGCEGGVKDEGTVG